ncbi:MAG: UvrD-helicase domain-containing protein [bacterium]
MACRKPRTPARKKASPKKWLAFGYPLNPAQRKAVTHGEGPLLIVAGAGTGKTTVIAERIAWLIREGKAKPEEILALTFTDKAAGEMEERVDRLLPYGYVDIAVSTFHAFGERILRDFGLEIGLSTDFKLLSAADQWLLLRRNLDRFSLSYYKPLGNPTRFLHALLEHFSRAKDENIIPDDYRTLAKKALIHAKKGGDDERSEAARLTEVAGAYATYEALLRESGHIDFGDCIVQTLRLFRERPKILADLQKRYRYLLVDEFQDTNYAQYELVKLLAGAAQNVTTVGDDDQSIYKFRGAAVSNILEFKKDFPKSDEVVLTENYRSRQNILDLAYRFIQQNNPHRLEARLGATDVGPKGKPLTHPLSKKLHAGVRGKGIILYDRFSTDDAEATWVVERILELKNADPESTWNDFAILLRANSQADLFLRRCERAGIPFHFLAARGLYQRPEVLDLIAFLKMLDNYHESPAFFRVLSMEVFHISHRDITLLLRFAQQKHLSLYLAAEQADAIAGITAEGRRHLLALLTLVHEHAEFAHTKTAGEVLYGFLRATKYLDRFDRDRDSARILNIAKFYRRIREFEETNDDTSVRAFIEETNLVVEIGEDPSPAVTDEGPEAVRLMTVHGAKGLEFSYVFLPQLVDQRFPSVERREAIALPDALIREIVFAGDAHLEEERRLLYVGITRAKKGVFLSSAEDYGGARKKKPSRFLSELGFVDAAISPSAKPKQLGLDLSHAPHAQRRLSAATYELPSRFSYTQLAAFRACPKQYWYAHILKIPVTGNPNFSFGKSIHATLRDFFRRLQESVMPSEKELLQLYEKNWIGDWYASDADEQKRKEAGRVALTTHYRKISSRKIASPLAIEKEFNLKLGSCTLRGFIDRIDAVPGSGKDVIIIDYKTGSVPKKKAEEDLDQLMLYAMAAKDVLGLRPQKLVYLYIEHDTEISFTVSEQTMAATKKRILERIAAIKTSTFRATPGWQCRYCDFREICEDREV